MIPTVILAIILSICSGKNKTAKEIE